MPSGDRPRSRRRVLAAGTSLAAVGFAGCSSRSPGSETQQSTEAGDASATERPTPGGDRDAGGSDERTIYVATDGDDGAPGTDDAPVQSIRRGLERAQPGDTVELRPGTYHQDIKVPHGGEPGRPIELTGPPDAVIRGAGSREDGIVLFNTHSHFHITGCTFDGLWRPDRPDDPASYRTYLIWTRSKTETYLTDVTVSPHAVGNARYSFIDFNMTNDVDVGGFEVIGPAGAGYVHGDSDDHQGEIVYVGSPPVEARNLQEDGILHGADESHDYRIHHIDNSAGYHHSELVNTKPGTHDVTVEYCTDGGGGYDTDQSTNASVAIQGHDSVVRWNDLRGGDLPEEAVGPTHGVKIDADVPAYCERDDGPQRCVGFGNSIYGNRITGFSGKAVFFEAIKLREYAEQNDDAPEPAPNAFPADQVAVCGNEISGPTHADPASACPADLPTTDEIGHTGGEPS